MPRSAPTGSRVTEAEFLSLPESLDRVELVDGEVIVSPAPSDRHQRLVVELAFALRRWTGDNPPAQVRVAPLDVRLGPGRILQPDLFLVLAGIPKGVAGPLDILPDIVVEILSARRSYDRLTKRVLYAEAGVPEYWIVDADQRQVEVLTPDGVDHVIRDVLRSPNLPGFELALDALFDA